MTGTSPQPHFPHPGQPQSATRRTWLGRTASAVLTVLDEMNDAQRRATRARLAYDLLLPDPGKAPETYQEFLLRTSGPAPHEPSAQRRAAGRHVR
jgi:hypothetical protein